MRTRADCSKIPAAGSVFVSIIDVMGIVLRNEDGLEVPALKAMALNSGGVVETLVFAKNHNGFVRIRSVDVDTAPKQPLSRRARWLGDAS